MFHSGKQRAFLGAKGVMKGGAPNDQPGYFQFAEGIREETHECRWQA